MLAGLPALDARAETARRRAGRARARAGAGRRTAIDSAGTPARRCSGIERSVVVDVRLDGGTRVGVERRAHERADDLTLEPKHGGGV